MPWPSKHSEHCKCSLCRQECTTSEREQTNPQKNNINWCPCYGTGVQHQGHTLVCWSLYALGDRLAKLYI